MNFLDIIDKVSEHLIKQGKKSLLTSTDHMYSADCMYRGSDGLSCAIGGLIDDAYYKPEFENKKPTHSDVYTAVLKSLCIDESKVEEDIKFHLKGLLCSLQKIHDMYEPESWKIKMAVFRGDIEARYLKYPEEMELPMLAESSLQ